LPQEGIPHKEMAKRPKIKEEIEEEKQAENKEEPEPMK